MSLAPLKGPLKVIQLPLVHWGWLIQRTGAQITENFKAIAAIDANDIIRGVVGYDNWTPNSVQCHMAVDTPAAWKALVYDNDAPAFRYPFEECGRGIIIAVVHESNAASSKLVSHFGFTETHRILDGVKPGEALILYEMRKADCRWLSRPTRVRPTLKVVSHGR